MSYQQMSRRRGNGFDIPGEGHAADAHYDRLGQDHYSSEAIRADNLQTMDADLDAAQWTLSERVTLDPMEQQIATMEQQIAADEQRIISELAAQRLVDDQGQLLWPTDPGQDPSMVSADIPTLPSAMDDEILAARQLEAHMAAQEIDAMRAQDYDLATTGMPTLAMREGETTEIAALQQEALREALATQSLSQAQRANVMDQLLLTAARADMIRRGHILPQDAMDLPPRMPAKSPLAPKRPPARGSVTPPKSYDNPYPEMPPPPPLHPVPTPRKPKPKPKPSVVPIVGAGLLALALLRR